MAQNSVATRMDIPKSGIRAETGTEKKFCPTKRYDKATTLRLSLRQWNVIEKRMLTNQDEHGYGTSKCGSMLRSADVSYFSRS